MNKKISVVTGASSGLALAIARKLWIYIFNICPHLLRNFT